MAEGLRWVVRVGLIWGLTVCCVSPRSGDDLPNGLAAVRNRHGAARGVAQVACNLWGPQAVEAFRVLRWVLSRLRALTLPALGVFGRAG